MSTQEFRIVLLWHLFQMVDQNPATTDVLDLVTV